MNVLNFIIVASIMPLLSVSTMASDSLSPEAEAVKKYILTHEYFEVFDTTNYRIRAHKFLVNDINGDGTKEIFLLLTPHFQQSPTILIYRYQKDGNVTRFTEGLAPGILIPATNNLLDAHALGVAIDMVATENSALDPAKLINAQRLAKGGCLVLYRTFMHMDMRKGNPTYLDMRHVPNIPNNQHTCEGFEFSPVLDIEIGRFEQHDKALFALTDKLLTVYILKSFGPDGLLDKEIQMIPLKGESVSLLRDVNGNILVVDRKGRSQSYK